MEGVESHRKSILLSKGCKALKAYQAKKSKEDNDYRLARKFRYATLLERSIKTFKRVMWEKERKEYVTKIA